MDDLLVVAAFILFDSCSYVDNFVIKGALNQRLSFRLSFVCSLLLLTLLSSRGDPLNIGEFYRLSK